MATNVTVKGQVTLPKAVREAAGIRPGDRVTVRARPEGGVIIERETTPNEDEAFRARLKEIARRRPLANGPFGGQTTDQIMRLLRGDD
ncbi:AbrB/MazE/SpoVT family DNA-binding domain-containing protein [Roseiarcus sp.]|jgi:AbrB family looped-hinge helix DNA binding protein|uniref:AbrB/MazE/SpoVT family DNA-binding domain-containing protein n=1 Tax=Roseiarcus sp. TaxID=1969460 RepID=UPI003F95E315